MNRSTSEDVDKIVECLLIILFLLTQTSLKSHIETTYDLGSNVFSPRSLISCEIGFSNFAHTSSVPCLAASRVKSANPLS